MKIWQQGYICWWISLVMKPHRQLSITKTIEGNLEKMLGEICTEMRKKTREMEGTLLAMSILFTLCTYTECQKKLITSSGRLSLKSMLSKLMIFGHKQALILLNKNIWKTQDFLVPKKRRKLQLNHERSFFENCRNCSPSKHHGGSLFRTFNSYSSNFNGGLRKPHTGFCLLRTPSPRCKQFLWFLKIDLLRFHCIYLLFDWSKILFFKCAY